MARYTAVPTTDPNWGVLNLIDRAIKKYVVTWLPLTAGRVVFGIYSSARKAFAACKVAEATQATSFPKCFLLSTGIFYAIDNGGRFH